MNQALNTRYLLMNNNWSRLIIEANEENINEIIKNAGFFGNVGILSIDIDGNDYWVLEAIECINPQILICEYNNLFGNEKR